MASSRSSDRLGVGGGGARNMKSMRPPLVVMFLMTYFYRAGGGAWLPRPPDPLLVVLKPKSEISMMSNQFVLFLTISWNDYIAAGC